MTVAMAVELSFQKTCNLAVQSEGADGGDW